jgi:hypothetical protein
MSLIDNKFVQIGLVVLAIYIVMQIMNKDITTENMDTVVTVTPEANALANVSVAQNPFSGTQVSLTSSPPDTIVNITPASNSLSATPPVPSNALVTQELAGSMGAASAIPFVTSAPSAAISGSNIPSALTSVEEAAAPAPLTMAETQVTANQNIFAPEPTDLDAMFGRRSQIDPADLIPKVQDAELYGGIQPDPKFNQNFLQNRWSHGIDVSKPKRGFVNDLRGSPPMPQLSVISPFMQPTQMPDLYRKSLAEIC